MRVTDEAAAAGAEALPVWEVHPGSGPFLLLVHGFLSSRAQWRPNLAALGKVCRPVVLELLGHGRSPAPQRAAAYTPEGYVAALEAIRRSLGIERWFICGYSLGGALTLRYALAHPGRVIGQMFTNSMSAFAGAKLARQWAVGAEREGERIASGGLAAIERIAVHPRNARRLPQDIHRALVADAALLKPLGIANTLRFTTPFASVRDAVCDNRVPSLLACGRFEKRFQPHRAFAKANMPHLQVVDLDAGHAVNMQDAAGFNRAACAFIASGGERLGDG